MFARKQIDLACFRAARDYTRLYEDSRAGRLKASDPGRESVSGARSDHEGFIDHQVRATRTLERIEGELLHRYGAEGVTVLRDILGRGCTIEAAARECGEVSKSDSGWVGGLFRRVLRGLAIVLGYATRDAYRRMARAQ
jgi:hypothetical protein